MRFEPTSLEFVLNLPRLEHRYDKGTLACRRWSGRVFLEINPTIAFGRRELHFGCRRQSLVRTLEGPRRLQCRFRTCALLLMDATAYDSLLAGLSSHLPAPSLQVETMLTSFRRQRPHVHPCVVLKRRC